MGTFTVSIEVGDFQGLRFERTDALVDTGASYTLVPRPVLDRLGVAPRERLRFSIADERIVEYDVGDTPIRMDGRTRFSPVIFGEADSQPLLGAFTLEVFGLTVDPVAQTLVPRVGLLKPQSRMPLRSEGY